MDRPVCQHLPLVRMGRVNTQMAMPVKVLMAITLVTLVTLVTLATLVLMPLTLMEANLLLSFLHLTPLQPVLRHTPSDNRHNNCDLCFNLNYHLTAGCSI